MSDELELQTPPEDIGAEGAETEGESSTPEPETQESQEPDTQQERTGVQSRIDELTARRREAERDREYWREMAMRGIPQEQPRQSQVQQDLSEPKSSNFEEYDQFVSAHAKWAKDSAKRELMAEFSQTQKQQTINNFNDRGRSKYGDYDDMVGSVPISEFTAEVLVGLGDGGVDLAYYLGKNPDTAKRIYGMSPERQAYELGKLEGRLKPPPQRTTTNAPKPTSPVGGKELPSKKLEDMDIEEYKAYREKQLYGR